MLGGLMSDSVEYTHIKIISIPSGFPPDEVRKYWVGAIIPLADPCNPESQELQWNPRTGEIMNGISFEVNTIDAMNELQKQDETAYQWFVDNHIARTYPIISFQSDFCELCKIEQGM